MRFKNYLDEEISLNKEQLLIYDVLRVLQQNITKALHIEEILLLIGVGRDRLAELESAIKYLLKGKKIKKSGNKYSMVKPKKSWTDEILDFLKEPKTVHL